MGSSRADERHDDEGDADGLRHKLARLRLGGHQLECAGGEFWRMPRKKGEHTYAVIASNGRIRKQIERTCGPLDPDGLLKK